MGAAAESMHKELVEQLKAPGRMFIPVSDSGGQGIYVVDKDKDGRVTKERTMDVVVSTYLIFFLMGSSRMWFVWIFVISAVEECVCSLSNSPHNENSLRNSTFH